MENLTPNYNLIKPEQADFYDVDIFNNNFDVIDAQLVNAGNQYLGFRGLKKDPILGISPLTNISEYPEGRSSFYTDTTDWAMSLNMTGFITTQDFLFIETQKAVENGIINAVQYISRYKKAAGQQVTMIEQWKRAWYTGGGYDGWSNAIKAVSKLEFDGHLAEDVPHEGKALKGYSEILDTPTIATGQTTLDMTNGNVFNVALTENTEFIFTNPSETNTSSITLILTQDATERTVTYPASVKWSGGDIPDLSTVSQVYVLTFVTIDEGVTWLGFLAGDFDVS